MFHNALVSTYEALNLSRIRKPSCANRVSGIRDRDSGKHLRLLTGFTNS